LNAIVRGLTRNTAQTDPASTDRRLVGRTYAIPFDQVWRAAAALADGGLWGWRLVESDDVKGTMHAESKTLLLRLIDDVHLHVGLDQNGQTQVRMRSASRKGRGDLGRNRRTIGRFLQRLDRRLEARPEQIIDPASYRGMLRSLLTAVLLLAACSSPPPDESPVEGATQTQAAAGNFRSRVFERNFVFTTLMEDSALLVPWLTTARTQPEGVQRTARGWLARGGTWDGFYDREWQTPPTRVPERLLPHESLRLIVGPEGAVVGILYHEQPRSLELSLAGVLMEWVDPGGESYRLVEAALYLADQRVQGVVLDMARTRDVADGPGGDWCFLVSGDSLQVVVAARDRQPPGTEGAFRGWARLDFRDLRYSAVTVDWGEVRAYQPARQDVPVAWTITSSGQGPEGVLEVRAAHIAAGEGDGPLLPVDALFEVTGTLTIEGGAYPVRGLFRHTGG